MTEWTGRTAVEIAAAVREERASAVDVTRQHLDRIARLDPGLSAFRHVRAEQALAEAAAVDQHVNRASLPLAGVPVAVKDNIAVAGEQSRIGSAATSPDRSPDDHVIVQRLRAAGAVVVGLTNVPELCLVPMADSVYGIARNPWDERRTPGGSSGGSAAAVAAGLVPLAHGNDGFGSIRIPCACCGTVGIKPGRGVVPLAPSDPTWDNLVENGPIATTVRDAALGLAVMAGEPGLAHLGEPGALRIGVSVRSISPGFAIVAPYRRAALEAGTLLEGLGHSVTRHTRRYPAWLGPASLSSWYASARESAAGLDRAGLNRSTRRLTAVGGALAAFHVDGSRARDRWRTDAAERFFGQIDVLLLPALSRPAARAERWGNYGGLRVTAVSTRTASLFGPWNIAGWPALAVPVGVGADAMPVAVQLVAKPGGERLLLELAAQIEAAKPWPRHAPRYLAEDDGNGDAAVTEDA
ncbi:amidase [Streptomyces sp. NPDC058231]|uniref:amidase n=1 Tax=Streptomyces sp. NPDC058231 TaxID=3346392 RepID=UPI0036EF2FAF